ncbi:hypothetical protein [Pikeienuella piscinae]|uniref:hypothetical protein n=1 Tax=Pikeienuella piscinae TaxID=2748098 RepID=UPI001FE3D512|nr:hypothetical protein [Pikeienuella piscinae]
MSDWPAHFGYMEATLSPSGHFVLDDLPAADVMLNFTAEIAISRGTGERLPKLAAFVATIHERPAWKRALKVGGDYAFA